MKNRGFLILFYGLTTVSASPTKVPDFPGPGFSPLYPTNQQFSTTESPVVTQNSNETTQSHTSSQFTTTTTTTVTEVESKNFNGSKSQDSTNEKFHNEEEVHPENPQD